MFDVQGCSCNQSLRDAAAPKGFTPNAISVSKCHHPNSFKISFDHARSNQNNLGVHVAGEFCWLLSFFIRLGGGKLISMCRHESLRYVTCLLSIALVACVSAA